MAFRSLAAASGPVDRLSVYLAKTSSAGRVELGLYRNRSGRPSKRLGRCMVTATRPGAWNSCGMKPVTVWAGIAYWATLLQPRRSKGRLRFLMTRTGRRSIAMRSSRAGLKRLPRSMRRGRMVTQKGRASLFADTAETTPLSDS